MLGIWCLHNWENYSQYPKLAKCKNWDFVEQSKASILIFKFKPILDKLQKNLKPLGPTRQPPYLNSGASPCRLPSNHGHHCSAMPIILPPPPPRPTASSGYKRGTPPPPWSNPFFLLRRFTTTAPPRLPSWSHGGPPLWSLSEPPDTTPKFTPTPWGPSTPLAAPSATPPARTHHPSTSPPLTSLVSLPFTT
jgi:hypothetical protein